MLRQRNPFRAPSEDSISTATLDVQQQDEIIARLSSENERSNAALHVALQAILGASIVLQLFFFFQASTRNPAWTPLSEVLPSENPQPRIPVAHFWTLLNILYHVHSILLLRPGYISPALLETYIRRVHSIPIWLVTIIAPTLSVLLRRDVPQYVWWSIPGCVTAAVTSAKQSIKQSREDILHLTNLKYNLQGA
ncbi:uncharacterized protein EI90DRAFT_3091082 [Cantharellus anzutake]|uniref:uncharacterized protein n=1 Tax=Cantharellus anzutake TaxID=1750568 RepID=UPI00190412D4|nr:uncharacterized protein EI90DRAFT_3091082 [Cantharellus anzutake]KAF8313961.1 hypothetical protein EI90DRAFT_3091082 [Cantharellus anzutake]